MANPQLHCEQLPHPDYTHRPAAGPAGRADRLDNLTITASFHQLNEKIRAINKVIHSASIAGHANTRYIPLYRFEGATYNLFPQDSNQVNQINGMSKFSTTL